MKYTLKKENKYTYQESGEGTPLIILHGLMGNLSNFDGVFNHFSNIGFRVIMPELPLYSLPLLKTNVKNLSSFVKNFTKHLGLNKYILIGNSLGGHVALYHTKLNPKNVSGLVLTGSSGLYENAMGGSYPKRGDYEYIKTKTQDVFYDPKMATKEVVDDVFETLNNRSKLIRTLAIAKSAIRHNMAKDLPEMKQPTCLLWGKNDNVTPPEVAEEFHKLLPNSELFWFDKCGHAPMMERPKQFNIYLEAWLKKYF
ncbi:MAG: alpha/beta fold hydrolase [Flavobacteriaceae bacterium]|nr:alpha/beta fold hydrolase [Flavobacteriaceae bacterium]